MKNKSKFKDRAFKIVADIPKGKTLSYKEVAQKTGSPRAYRAVGNILNKNHDPDIPCHRVILSDGTAGGYNKGADQKISKLKREKAI